jgi:hypothetical protein
VAVTVALRDVVPVVKMEAVPTLALVVLANCGVTVVQFLTRFAMFTLPRPVAAL